MGVLIHYGTPRHSGRYPWGSGKNPQRSKNFLQRANELAAQGLSEKEQAAAFKMSVGDYRAQRKIYREDVDMENQRIAIKLKEKEWSNTAIAEKLGVSEGTVRNMLNPNRKHRESVSRNIAAHLKELLEEKPYLDIGEGVDRQLNISEEQMRAARLILQDEGYNVYTYRIPQINNKGQYTNTLILTKGDVTRSDLGDHLGEITSPDGLYFKDYGEIAVVRKPIPSIDSSRVAVRYAEDGGTDKDGVIEIRPGVEDLTLGGRSYAQVRIGVDGTHYLKGMAIYGTKMPEGVDVVFNTNKHQGTPMLGDDNSTVLKLMKNDPKNPFGAAFRQWEYEDANGNSQVSPINIVNDDEDWTKWKKNLSSQFLSKQTPALAKRQLDLRYAEMADEFEDLKSLTNPTIKRQLCEEFADSCDSAAVHLKAAALPRQASFAILPVTSLKDNEVYAPMYKDGEEVILVRHPHAGTFEIPRLIVNNGNKEGKEAIGTTAPHAVGINPKVAAQLSGADFDGDTVLVIPTQGQKFKTREPLEGLIGFSPTEQYSRLPGDPIHTGKTVLNPDGTIKQRGDGFNKGKEMGSVSNLITDMTIKGATDQELERAVRHSMVVIDAEKHNLDWKRSELDNDIANLRSKYQSYYDDNGRLHVGGAATLISRAKGRYDMEKQKPVYSVKDMTDEERERYERGEVVTRGAGETYKDPKTGKIKTRTITVTKMEATDDAYTLSSGSPMENTYAAYANQMKALANEARKEARSTGLLQRNPSAEKTYAEEVKSLNKKIVQAEAEAPKERQAQAIANSYIRARTQADPSLKDPDNKDKLKKLSAKALSDARDQVRGGTHEKRYRISLTDNEWDAIQAGAISNEKMKTIIRYSDKDEIKKRAMPRQNIGMKPSARARARLLLNSGVAPSAVAEELGVSTATLAKEFGNFKGIGGE